MTLAARPVLAYVRPGPHPYANTSLAEALAIEFDDYDVKVIDVVDAFRAKPTFVARAAAAAVAHYGVDFARRVRNPKDALLRTPTAASLLRRTALEALSALPVAPTLTLQIQSLFDGHLDGVPHFVYTDHTHLANLQYTDFDPARLYATSWIEAEREIYRNATGCFVRSTHVARSLAADYRVPADRVELVYAGINAKAGEAVLADPAASEQITFVGVDWLRKGGPTLLAAFGRVRANHPNATLVVVGCEAPFNAVPPGVRFVGRISLDEVGDVLATSGVFCLPTTVEPFGIAFLEAMACGLPIVATKVGAVPDMVEQGVSGLLVEPGDEVALAEALGRMLSDPALRATAGGRGRELIAQRYNWTNVAAAMRRFMSTHLEVAV